jgi:hypothetical protein
MFCVRYIIVNTLHTDDGKDDDDDNNNNNNNNNNKNNFGQELQCCININLREKVRL